MNRLSSSKFILFINLLLMFLAGFTAQANNDEKALNGIKEVRAIYDVRVNEPQKFAFFLEVIGRTYDGILAQGVHPEFVVAVRGPAIRFISSETWSFSDEDQKYLESSARLIGELKSRGVIFEACSIAAGLFKVDHQTYLPGVSPVSNTFISLTGYQAQGYGLVPIN